MAGMMGRGGGRGGGGGGMMPLDAAAAMALNPGMMMAPIIMPTAGVLRVRGGAHCLYWGSSVCEQSGASWRLSANATPLLLLTFIAWPLWLSAPLLQAAWPL